MCPLPKAWLLAALAGLASAPLLSAQTIANDLDPYGKNSQHFTKLFQPPTTDRAALSPDGRHVAYTRREGSAVYVCIISLDNPNVMKAHVLAVNDEAAAERIDETVTETALSAVTWMEWVSPNRLVLETNQRSVTALDFSNNRYGGVIFALNADGSDARLLAGQRTFSYSGMKAPKGGSSMKRSSIDNSDTSDANIDPTTGAPIDDNSIDLQHRFLTPHVVDLLPNNEEEILVRTDLYTNSVNAIVFQEAHVNINSGKTSKEEEYYTNNLQITMLDRQGLPRLTVPYSSRLDFPECFTLLPTSFFGHDRKMDDLMPGSPLAGSFRLSPQNYLYERSIPLGFDEDPNLLYFASNVGKERFGIYSVNVKTGVQSTLKVEHPIYDLFEPAPNRYPDQKRTDFVASDRESLDGRIARPDLDSEILVHDRFTRKLVGFRFVGDRRTAAWVNGDLMAVQTQLEQLYPGASVTIIGWDKEYHRFLARTEGVTNPGAFIVFDRATNRLYDLVQTAPWLPSEESNTAAAFSLTGQNGTKMTGVLVLPRKVRIQPVPIIVYMPSIPWKRIGIGFTPEVQALSEMGFAVLQINARGSFGYGKTQLHESEDNRTRANVEDILQVVDHLAPRFKLNGRAIGLVGEYLGAYDALRALQLAPDRFKCGIVINPVIDLQQWATNANWGGEDALPILQKSYFEKELKQGGSPVLGHAALIRQPVLYFGYRGRMNEESTRLDYQAIKTLAGKASNAGKDSTLIDINEDYLRGKPGSRAQVYRNIEGFLNMNMYRFKSLGGSSEIIEEPKAPPAPETPKVQIIP